MDFGAVGGLIRVGTLLWEAYQLYKEAPENFKEISSDLLSILALLDAVDETLSGRDLTNSEETHITTIRNGCTKALNNLQRIVRKYQDGGIFDRLLWPTKDIKKLRARLTLNFTLLGNFIKWDPHSFESIESTLIL